MNALTHLWGETCIKTSVLKTSGDNSYFDCVRVFPEVIYECTDSPLG
ncbi:hypothetical protein CHISP_3201 [Chitinispirillum alkaliphilum]|nr:hypothetical protein CHISP_3201 [Chitinispirillum alkaliphilum]